MNEPTEDESTDESIDDTTAHKAATEAARYRRALRATEDERDALAAQLRAARHNLIAARMGGRVRPDVFDRLCDEPLSSFFDKDTGEIDTARLDEAVGTVLEMIGPPSPAEVPTGDDPEIGGVLAQGLTSALHRPSVAEVFHLEEE